jgi:hypothetical protein
MSAVAAATIGSAIIGAGVSISASKRASKTQLAAADRTADEQRAAREEMRTLLNPYVSAGTPALQAQMASLGLSGPEAQQAYISQQEQSPFFQALAAQGEDAIRQNASATGGLRGGNIQGALAQFLDQQYGRLAGLSTLGQASAAGVATNTLNSATNIGNAYTQAGQAQAGGILGQANAFNQAIGTIGGQLPGLFKPPVTPSGVPTPPVPPQSGMIGPSGFTMSNINQRTF